MFKGIKQDLKDIYDSRNILRALIVKDLFGRYRNSALGFLWHFVLPLVMMVVYYIAFSTIRATPISDFWIYLSSGLFPFVFMTSNLTRGAGSITSNAGMVKKMYFPRSILVLSEVISSFIVMLMGYCVILVIIVVSGHQLGISIVLLPIIMIAMAVFVTGYVLVLSALNVYARDVQHLLNSVSMVFYFITPMYFMMSDLSGLFQKIVMLNPFTYYVEAYHQIVYSGVMPDTFILLMCLLMPPVSIVLGVIVFCKLRHGFAERL